MADATTAPQVDREFAALIPPLAAEEFAQLEANILADGCRVPLDVWSGILLDGHNRLRICEKHGLPYGTAPVELPDRDAARDWMLANQLGRRNLTRDAFTVLLGRRYQAQKQAGWKTRSGQSDQNATAAERIAADHHVSEKTVRRAAAAIETLPEPVVAAVVRGETTLRQAKRAQRDRAAEERRERTARENPPADKPSIDLNLGDFRTVLADVRGVDAIITDPPYGREYLPLLADLARWSDLVLAPDGVLAVLFGQSHLPDVYRLLSGGRPYRWTACYLTEGPGYVSHQARVQSGWKPVLIYGGGPRLADVVRSGGNGADKELHEWGQNYCGFATLVERLTLPGQTVCDPFAGGGTTLAAAVHGGRHVIGAEIDPEHFKTMHDRLCAP